jgi:DNA polymerase III epsilon subunit-like protein
MECPSNGQRQLASLYTDCLAIARRYGKPLGTPRLLVAPDGFDVPFEAEQIHGISTALAQDQGLPLLEVLERFTKALEKCHFVVGQNVGFDLNIMGAEFHRAGVENLLTPKTCLRYLYRADC